jgi:hypothetical protein
MEVTVSSSVENTTILNAIIEAVLQWMCAYRSKVMSQYNGGNLDIALWDFHYRAEITKDGKESILLNVEYHSEADVRVTLAK